MHRHATGSPPSPPYPITRWDSSPASCPELKLPRRHQVLAADINPAQVQRTLLRTYAAAAADFEQLLGVRGVGAKGLRALALVAEIIHGTPASMRDPARFAFAHGGKDGIPYPVDRGTYRSKPSISCRRHYAGQGWMMATSAPHSGDWHASSARQRCDNVAGCDQGHRHDTGQIEHPALM
ncbi:MAG: DUF763 domain-containing protein [Gammaproteobacteria bacterium]|nr:DUF763 domain-containing protein [Gammaproteobacteria bacterium]